VRPSAPGNDSNTLQRNATLAHGAQGDASSLMDRDAWQTALAVHSASRPTPAVAHTYVKVWGTASQPVLLLCNERDTSVEYVVKGTQAGRTLVNDHIVARLGELIAAPTGHVALVDVPRLLVDNQPEMSHMTPGVAHGSGFMRNCTEREGLLHTAVPENRQRFASLAVLFGWTWSNDEQFIYENAPPHLVWSVDHGHFFHGPSWTEASLSGAPPVDVSATLQAACQFSDDELADAVRPLGQLSDDAIAEVVAGPPDAWGMTMSERVTLAAFLAERRDQLLAGAAS